MKSLNFIIRLMDRVSGPAMRAVASLGALQGALSATGRAGGLVTAGLAGMGGVSRRLTWVRRRVTNLLWSFRDLYHSVFNVRTAILSLTASMGVAFALQAASFKESTIVAMQVMAQDIKKGNELFADAVRFAQLTPFTTRQVVEGYQKLLAFKFTDQEVPVLMRAVGDVAALHGFRQDLIDRLILNLGQIRSFGKLTGRELRDLATAGLPMAAVFEVMAEKLGKTTEQVQELQSKGLIGAELAIYSITEAVRRLISGGGDLGDFMARQAETMAGLWSTVRSRPFEILMDLDEGKGFARAKQFLRNLRTVTDESNQVGQKLKGLAGGGFDRLLTAIFDPLATFTNPAKFSRTLDILERRLERFGNWWRNNVPPILDFIKDFALGMFTGVTQAARAAEPVINLLGKLFGMIGGGPKGEGKSMAFRLGQAIVFMQILKVLTMLGGGAIVGGIFRLGKGIFRVAKFLFSLAFPGALVVKIILLLASAFIFLYRNSERFRKVVDRLTGAIAGFFDLKMAKKQLADLWRNISFFFSDVGALQRREITNRFFAEIFSISEAQNQIAELWRRLTFFFSEAGAARRRELTNNFLGSIFDTSEALRQLEELRQKLLSFLEVFKNPFSVPDLMEDLKSLGSLFTPTTTQRPGVTAPLGSGRVPVAAPTGSGTLGGVNFEVTINDARDPERTANLVAQRISDELHKMWDFEGGGR